jgi:hypothetical protein
VSISILLKARQGRADKKSIFSSVLLTRLYHYPIEQFLQLEDIDFSNIYQQKISLLRKLHCEMSQTEGAGGTT